MKPTDNDLIATYLEKVGRITRIEAGERATTERDMYRSLRGDPSDNELIAERHVRGNVVYNGLGEPIGRI